MHKMEDPEIYTHQIITSSLGVDEEDFSGYKFEFSSSESLLKRNEEESKGGNYAHDLDYTINPDEQGSY